jgi:hypothetical protein
LLRRSTDEERGSVAMALATQVSTVVLEKDSLPRTSLE